MSLWGAFGNFGKLGSVASGAGSLPWDVETGLLAFEDMSQSQLQSGLTALGFTQTRTGTALRSTDGQSFYDVAQNVLGMMPGSTSRYGLFVGSAVTNRCLRSRDLTNAAWTKTNVTAALATGGLVHDADWLGPELASGWLDSNTGWTGADGTNFTISDGTVTSVGTTVGARAQRAGALTAGKYYWIAIEGSGSGLRVEGVQGGGENDYVTNSTSPAIIFSGTGNLSIRHAGTAGETITSLSIREVDAHTVLTATANNSTCVQTITDTSNERVSGVWAKRSVGTGRVWMSQGAVTGSALYEDDFSTDTSSEWARGTNSVDGTITVTGGKLVYTQGAGDTGTPSPRIVRTITGFTVGKRYRNIFSVSGTGTGERRIYLAHSASGVGAGATADIVPSPQYFTATQSTYYFTAILVFGVTGSTLELDDISVQEVAETELFLDSTIQLTRTPAATIANPQIAFRFETSGDEIEVYNVNAQRGTVLEDPIVTAGSTVTRNAETCVKTLSVSPAALEISGDIKITHNFSTSDIPIWLLVTDVSASNFVSLDANTSRTSWQIRRRKLGGSITTISSAISESGDYSIDAEASAAAFRFRVDGGSYVSGSAESLGTFTQVHVGCYATAPNSYHNAPTYRITGIPQ